MMFLRIPEAVEYHYALMLMKKTLRMRIDGGVEDHVYLLEHKPVITIGRDGDASNIITKSNDIPIFYIKRGGDATLHSPGQLVVYPIIKIDEKGISLRDMITVLEESVIDMLKTYGLRGYWKKGTAGVWVNNRKIASIGLALDHWTTYHGLALNINNDLTLFQNIRPCGLSPDEMTNLENEVGDEVHFENVVKKYMKCLSSSLREEYEIRYLHREKVISFLYG